MQERAQAKAHKVCNNFLNGTCTYGDGCRFGHDAAAYLSTAPANLPGPCPAERPDQRCTFGTLFLPDHRLHCPLLVHALQWESSCSIRLCTSAQRLPTSLDPALLSSQSRAAPAVWPAAAAQPLQCWGGLVYVLRGKSFILS